MIDDTCAFYPDCEARGCAHLVGVLTVAIDVPCQLIADLFTSAIGSSDPVTRGWLYEIKWDARDGAPKPTALPWWEHAENFDTRNFKIVVTEFDEDDPSRKTRHVLTRDVVIRGLKTMAEKYHDAFAQIAENNVDAPTADLFLQCCCFGEEKYA